VAVPHTRAVEQRLLTARSGRRWRSAPLCYRHRGPATRHDLGRNPHGARSLCAGCHGSHWSHGRILLRRTPRTVISLSPLFCFGGGHKLWAQVREAYPRAEAIVRERPPAGAKDWNDALQAEQGRQDAPDRTPEPEKTRGRDSRADERR